jgi:hypothetical protein
MKTRLKKLWCFIAGHDWNPIAADNGYLHCDRCVKDYTYVEPHPFTIANWLACKRSLLKWRAREFLLSVRRRFQKPSDDVPF